MKGNPLKKLYKWIKCIYENFVTILFVMIELAIILQIVARFSPKLVIPWTEELSRMLLIFCTLFGVVAVSRRGEHLGAYFLRDVSKGKVKGVLYLAGALSTVVFLIALAWGAIYMYFSVGASPATTTMPWLTRGMIYMVTFFSSVVMMIYAIRDVWHSILILMGKREGTKKGSSSPFPEED